jgi:UDP-glucose 4-epimerase
VREVFAAIAAETARNVPFVLGARRDGDPPLLVANPTTAKWELGFNPCIPISRQLFVRGLAVQGPSGNRPDRL